MAENISLNISLEASHGYPAVLRLLSPMIYSFFNSLFFLLAAVTY